VTGKHNAPQLGRIGIWAAELRHGDSGEIADAAAELDELGFGTLWIPGEASGDLLGQIDHLLGATRKATIATGILNIWMHDAKDVGAWWRALPAEHAERFLLGLGVSHGAVIGEAYAKPLTAMRNYLALLSAEGIPAEKTCLAALGPKMLELARDQTAGAHPYLITPEHTALARATLGPEPLLAPEQFVVLEADPVRARDAARPFILGYGRLANYANSWRRLGFSEDDIILASDQLVDALFAWGDADRIADRVNEHLTAGANHVCLQVIGTGPPGSADFNALRAAWRKLAEALL
jgi:probable F420-dependent oxidoreductase